MLFIYSNILIFIIIIQSLFIITSKNTITSILFLINIYLITSICYLMIGAEFLALTLVIVYVGAISILFLFVIMMLNLRIVEIYDTLINYAPIGSFIGFLPLLEITYLINTDHTFYTIYSSNPYNNDWVYELSGKTNINFIGDLLYNYYYYLLWFAGLILLTAMIGAITLTIDSNYHIDQRFIQNSYFITRRLHTRISFWNYSSKAVVHTGEIKVPKNTSR